MRLRLLRILLPALLLPFLLLIVFTFRQRPPALSHGPKSGTDSLGPRAENIELTELWTGSRRLFIRAGLGEMDEEGRLRLEDVERVEVDRERGSPLVVRADRGKVEGKPGNRTMHLEGGVDVRDESAGLRLSLPGLEVDEAASEARSMGRVQFEGTGYEGTCRAIVYGLRKDQPTVLTDPDVQGKDASRLTARTATVLEGRQEMDLEGTVEVVQGPTHLRASRVQVVRDEEGRMRAATATGSVACSGLPVAGVATDLTSQKLRIEWDALGRPTHATAEGNPVLRRGTQSLQASAVEVVRRSSGREGWDFSARGGVRASGIFDRSPAVLTSEELNADLDVKGNLIRADALRGVRFEGSDALGEAALASYVPSGTGGEVTLLSAAGQPARLAKGRSRVAARKITTDPQGGHLVAENQVEATLLQSTKEQGKAKHGSLFEGSDTVHFVAARLEAEPAKGHFVFRGAVRGWQGERNLSGEEVEIDQERDTLKARTSVTSRFPRRSSVATSQSDYVQISADSLDYAGGTRRAVYEGNTKVRLTEGWLEGSRLEVDLDEAGKTIRELRVVGNVRFEMRAPAAPGADQGPVSGKGDRVIYSPDDQLVRLIGDEAPASVTRNGGQGGTTTGRVLRYRLDAGTLEVESEDRDRAPARTGGG